MLCNAVVGCKIIARHLEERRAKLISFIFACAPVALGAMKVKMWEAVGGRKFRQLWLHRGVRTLSVSPTQVQLMHATLSSWWHLRRPGMEAGSKVNRGSEGPRPGLDCRRCLDKTTGKDRLRQGNREGWLRLLLHQEELTHPSDHLPHLWSPWSDNVLQLQTQLHVNWCTVL